MLKLIFVVAIFFTAAYAHHKGAVYLADPSGNSHVVGSATFEEVNGGVHIKGEVRGLNPGNHGFHFHSLGNIANGCLGTASHFNPHNQNHGSPRDLIRHIGDLGNIVADSNGVAKIDLFDNVISLHGPNSIIGRAAVVHEKTDDLGKGGNADSLKTGNAGGRLACGVVGIN